MAQIFNDLIRTLPVINGVLNACNRKANLLARLLSSLAEDLTTPVIERPVGRIRIV